jgi:hypothetical protein
MTKVVFPVGLLLLVASCWWCRRRARRAARQRSNVSERLFQAISKSTDPILAKEYTYEAVTPNENSSGSKSLLSLKSNHTCIQKGQYELSSLTSKNDTLPEVKKS